MSRPRRRPRRPLRLVLVDGAEQRRGRVSTPAPHGDFDRSSPSTPAPRWGSASVAAGGTATGDVCHGEAAKPIQRDVAGTTYGIAVDGAGDSTGSFRLGSKASPPTTTSAALARRRPQRRRHFDSNRFATKQAGEPDHAGNPGGASVWFKWTAPKTPKSASTPAAAASTRCSPSTQAQRSTRWRRSPPTTTPPAMRAAEQVAFARRRHHLPDRGRRQGRPGAVHLTSMPGPGNNDFAAAERPPRRSAGTVPGTTRLATKEAGGPDPAATRAATRSGISWTPRRAAAVELDVCSPCFEPVLGVFTGSGLGALTRCRRRTPARAAARRVEASASSRGRRSYRFAVDGAAATKAPSNAPAADDRTPALARRRQRRRGLVVSAPALSTARRAVATTSKLAKPSPSVPNQRRAPPSPVRRAQAAPGPAPARSPLNSDAFARRQLLRGPRRRSAGGGSHRAAAEPRRQCRTRLQNQSWAPTAGRSFKKNPGSRQDQVR